MVKKIGLVTGVFDGVHEGHVELIEKALAVVDQLYVGVESDGRVRQLKGEGRPVRSQEVRQKSLAELFPAVVVMILPFEFGEEKVRRDFLQSLRVNVLVMAEGDEREKSKRQLMRLIGGEVKVVAAKRDKRGEIISMTKIRQGKQEGQVA